MFLEILQNSEKNTFASVFFFDKVSGLRPTSLLKKGLWYRCFPKFCKSSKNNFSYRTRPVAASEIIKFYQIVEVDLKWISQYQKQTVHTDVTDSISDLGKLRARCR